MAGLRWKIEENNAQSKDLLGPTQYQVRKGTLWHRHVTSVMLALTLLAVTGSALPAAPDLPTGRGKDRREETTMPRLIDTTHDRITVDHFQFLLAGWLGGGYEDPAGWPSWDETAARAGRTDWFAVTTNRGVVTSAFSWHVAHATLELWDEEPLADGDRWDQIRTAGFHCSSGFAYLDGIYGRGPDFAVLDLRGEQRDWTVRACCRRGTDPTYPEDAPPLGLEEWRFQFWPAAGLDPWLAQAPRRGFPSRLA